VFLMPWPGPGPGPIEIEINDDSRNIEVGDFGIRQKNRADGTERFVPWHRIREVTREATKPSVHG
jgi:hypothetical protein